MDVVSNAIQKSGLHHYPDVLERVRTAFAPIIDLRKFENVEESIRQHGMEGKTVSQVLGATTINQMEALIKFISDHVIFVLDGNGPKPIFMVILGNNPTTGCVAKLFSKNSYNTIPKTVFASSRASEGAVIRRSSPEGQQRLGPANLVVWYRQFPPWR